MSAPRHDFEEDEDLRGLADADFLAIGLGGTNMMAMLWSVAMGRRAVGIEMRGDPFLGVHWNIRADLYHQLGLIDRMMLERYGEAGVPKRANGMIFRLADCFYHRDTVAGDIVPDEIIDGFDTHQHIVGTIHHVEFIDDRWRDGVPHRVVTLLQPPKPPVEPAPEEIRTDMVAVLDGPSTFQAGAAAILVLLRRYLEAIEAMDLESGVEIPRVRLLTRHRVVPGKDDGFIRREDGRVQIRVEHLQELDFRGKFLRVRMPGTSPIDLGVPELFMIAQGFDSNDATRLGFRQEDVAVDHGDGRGAVVAQADFLAGLIEVLVGGRLRRRISSEFDADGKEYWVRQIAVGHENDPEVGWVLIQVPDFKTFDPIEAGLVSADIDQESPEYFAAYQLLVYDYYIEQASHILELPKKNLKKVQMVYGPKMFSLVEKMGEEARVATNGVVGGDSFGNGHFLTSGGAMTGMVGHSAGVLRYWKARDGGADAETAICDLAQSIREGTQGWLEVSAQEYSQAVPINFGAERIAAIAAATGLDTKARAHAIDATRRKRHSLLPLDPSDWRRLFLRNGRVLSAPLPELHAMHPALRGQHGTKKGAKAAIVFVAPAITPDALPFIDAVLCQPGARLALVSEAPAGALPENIRERIAAHIEMPLRDTQDMSEAVNRAIAAIGRPDALLGTPDVQVALAEIREALGIRGMRAQAARRFVDGAHVTRTLEGLGLTVAPAGRIEGQQCSLEVMSIGGVPAWFAATRRDGSENGAARSIVLPREIDDPADADMRQMGFAALRALGMDTGLSTITWTRRADGRAVISGIAPNPPDAAIVTLMGIAHKADMYRAWANGVVNGLFAPIPRPFASGAVFLSHRNGHAAGAGRLERMRHDMGDMIVEVRDAGDESEDISIFVRHAQTSAVEQALAELAAAV
ncbi:MAG: hypothetical protein QOF41_1321 [Methylobacteriaceae bacterium]|nr:hypothetical protein [Methylobacteriaceae bacterium]